MAKNIVLLSDGTGNSSAKVLKTNVWQTFQVLDLRDPTRQIAFYDDGVGTSSFKLFAILGGVFGFGLKRNVIAIYSFCCRNYQAGDQIYCFGFSRGAFTIRIVAGLIAAQGIVAYNNNEADLARFAADAYRAYRRRYSGGIVKALGRVGIDLRGIRDFGIRSWRRLWGQAVEAPPAKPVDSIRFVGIWDTVDAYGGPIQEMTRAIDYWVWPLSMPDHFMSAKIHRACHALALEDERDAFHPVIWDERYVRANATVANRTKTSWLFDINHDPRPPAMQLADPLPHLRTDLPLADRERISQVWFTGVHSDIGGGYPQNGLSYVTLDWMLDRAKPYGLRYLDEQREIMVNPLIDPTDKLNDSRKGLAGYYRYKPRNVLDIYHEPSYKLSVRADMQRIWRLLRHQDDPQTEILNDLHPCVPRPVRPVPTPIIHHSVFDRIRDGTDRYAPVVIPRTYKLADVTGAAVAGPCAPPDLGELRSHVQDDVWNWVWLRRVVYFLTAFATAFIAFIPYFVIYAPGFGHDTVGPSINPIINAGASFLPGFLDPWFVAFRNAPGFVLIGVIAVVALLYWGAVLQQKVRDVARIAWHAPQDYPELAGWRAFVYWLRRCGWYRAAFYILTHWILPTLIMWWLFWWLAFGAANTLGLVCKGTGGVLVEATSTAVTPMDTANACNATGLRVLQDEVYQVTLTIEQPWKDSTIETDPNGFGNARASFAQMLGWPYKRLIWSNWFATILRVGGPGFEEHLLRLEQKDGAWTTTFVPRATGEVFLYVNDTVLSLPWIYNYFYRANNYGTAKVTIEKLPKPAAT
ncbi:DUF2235 domain-containing protein [Bradyrhizobium tropiciagri]|uniref:DUF2235 domain-containing protein n=1 Tax=Bradyrhizobium tropiciagri TaxID=312253 RepID=UPI001BADFD3E|nr:DUF2235 domain-containing protein [Bradyrhizobium tropiciagri]MBR0873140.1 DUF2235 domain-containing protein [Bradyrhizobium tropiciagri]